MRKNIPSVSVAYARNGASLADTSGWEHRGALSAGAGDASNKADVGQVGAFSLRFDGQDDAVTVSGFVSCCDVRS